MEVTSKGKCYTNSLRDFTRLKVLRILAHIGIGSKSKFVNNKIMLLYSSFLMYFISVEILRIPYTSLLLHQFRILIDISAYAVDSILILFGMGSKIYVKWRGGCLPPPPSKLPKSKHFFCFSDRSRSHRNRKSHEIWGPF